MSPRIPCTVPIRSILVLIREPELFFGARHSPLRSGFHEFEQLQSLRFKKATISAPVSRGSLGMNRVA